MARRSTTRGSLSPTFVNELRVGYARTNPFTTQSDYGLHAADSLGIQGINVSEITTGLPNINITDFTGISGGPAFLPVNPNQFHYQIENALVWIKGRHQMKFGYRLVDREPSPFTHTNTRSSITFGRNFANNPVTNTGGSGHGGAAVGYIDSAARGFLLESYTLRTRSTRRSSRTTSRSAGGSPSTPGCATRSTRRDRRGRQDRATSIRSDLALVYAGENGASRAVQQEDAATTTSRRASA